MTLAPAEARGELVFDAECYSCHPGGEGGLGHAFNHLPLPGFLVRTQIRVGLGAMPAIGRDRISDDELDDLMRYLRALRRH